MPISIPCTAHQIIKVTKHLHGLKSTALILKWLWNGYWFVTNSNIFYNLAINQSKWNPLCYKTYWNNYVKTFGVSYSIYNISNNNLEDGRRKIAMWAEFIFSWFQFHFRRWLSPTDYVELLTLLTFGHMYLATI